MPTVPWASSVFCFATAATADMWTIARDDLLLVLPLPEHSAGPGGQHVSASSHVPASNPEAMEEIR